MRYNGTFWDGILRWNFDVEHVDMILSHNVQYRASLSGLPILVPECSKGGHLEREACQRGWKFGFFRGQSWWNALKLSRYNPSPLTHHFHQASLSGFSGAMCYHAKPYRPDQRLLGSVRGWKKCKRVWEGENSKSKQNTLTTVGKSRPGTAGISSVFSYYSWGRSKHETRREKTVQILAIPNIVSSSKRTQSRSSSAVAREGRPGLDSPAVARGVSPVLCRRDPHL